MRLTPYVLKRGRIGITLIYNTQCWQAGLVRDTEKQPATRQREKSRSAVSTMTLTHKTHTQHILTHISYSVIVYVLIFLLLFQFLWYCTCHLCVLYFLYSLSCVYYLHPCCPVCFSSIHNHTYTIYIYTHIFLQMLNWIKMFLFYTCIVCLCAFVSHLCRCFVLYTSLHVQNSSFILISCFLFLSQTHTHTYTHAHKNPQSHKPICQRIDRGRHLSN